MSDFDRMYNANWESVYRLSYAMLGDPAEAEEAAQDVFVRVLCRRRGEKIEQKPLEEQRRYLFRAVGNYCADVFERRARTPATVSLTAGLPFDEGGGVSNTPAESEALRAAFLERSDRDREVLTLAFGFGLNLSEISDVLGISLSAARERRRKARHRLSQALQALGEQLPDPKDWPQDRGAVGVEANS